MKISVPIAISVCLYLYCFQEVSSYNPCCSFPCQNRGICMTEGFHDYSCDCINTGHTGRFCEIPATWMQSIKYWLKPSPETTHYILTNFKPLWDFINSVSFLQKTFMKIVYLVRGGMVDSPPMFESDHHYVTFSAAHNKSYYSRALPPIPPDCPTPMGVVGKAELPDVDVLVETCFRRHKFQPEKFDSNLLFTFFAQHFSHVFFKTDLKRGPQFTWGGHGVDVSHIYGPDKGAEDALRSFQDGKLKTQVINGEVWPPSVEEAPVNMLYPPHIPKDKQFAIGHEFYGLLPGLFVFATIWIREHNRVCDVLKIEHPEFIDEQLFQTAKLIILGETIKIVVEEYVQHISKYHLKLTFDPELLFGTQHQYQNTISLEFNHLYHWHPLMPDNFEIGGATYTPREFFFNNTIASDHGMEEMVSSFGRQKAGKVTSHNHSNSTLHIAAATIRHGRELRIQSLNNYRRRFRLKPYTTFEELTGERELAAKLEELYADIEAVEFYIGLMVEKHRENGMFGSTIIDVGAPFSVKGLMSNAICSPQYWRPSTFGGETGFQIVKSASLEKLFCQNMEHCPEISFSTTTSDNNDNLSLHYGYETTARGEKLEL